MIPKQQRPPTPLYLPVWTARRLTMRTLHDCWTQTGSEPVPRARTPAAGQKWSGPSRCATVITALDLEGALTAPQWAWSSVPCSEAANVEEGAVEARERPAGEARP
jgi:hypothetical protein